MRMAMDYRLWKMGFSVNYRIIYCTMSSAMNGLANNVSVGDLGRILDS